MRIGIYRIMRVLDRFGSARDGGGQFATAATRYPRVIDEMAQRKWEIMANGIDMGHVHHGNLSVEDERELIRQRTRRLAEVTGTPVCGWHSPGRSHSQNTLMLLAERGFQYVTDWANDDMPYMVTTTAGSLCAMPLTYEWSDRLLLVQHNLTVEDYEAQVLQAFARLHGEAGQHDGGRILSLSVSPWILGYPHRIRALERVLAQILEIGSVWHATGMEIVDAFKSQVAALRKVNLIKENRHACQSPNSVSYDIWPVARSAGALPVLLAHCSIATGVPTATPSFAQAGKIEKPDITFGVFPITNYGVVYLSIQQGFFQAEGPQRNAARDGRQSGGRHRRR